jgi:hypothetical protein
MPRTRCQRVTSGESRSNATDRRFLLRCYGNPYHFYVEAGLPQTQVLLWVSGESLRAAFDNVVLAEYHCRYDWRDRKVKGVREGVFHPTRFASPQGTLIPLTPQDSVVGYRAKPPQRRVPHSFPPPQLLLFEVVATGYGRLQCAPV